MKKSNLCVFVLLFILTGATISNAQVTQAVSINTTGNPNYTGAILDLSNNNTVGTVGFLPPYVSLTNITVLTTPITGGTATQLSGLVVYNANVSIANGLSGPGLYYWNNTLSTPSWVYLGPPVASSVTAVNNGLSLSGTTAQLGGSNLIQATTITNNTYNLAVTGSSVTTNFTTTGQVGIGNAAPNALAVVDLNNSTNWGLMMPVVTTANLPAITAAQNGLMLFNSTIGCMEFAYNGTWNAMGASQGIHGTATISSSTLWIVPSCVTTIT
ncbi:MAG TPA: hypothetical protein VK808_07605, partial [Bacteroidia bacterium]|nr:hypothetical protein [Bacteroidia bacterium]